MKKESWIILAVDAVFAASFILFVALLRSNLDWLDSASFQRGNGVSAATALTLACILSLVESVSRFVNREANLHAFFSTICFTIAIAFSTEFVLPYSEAPILYSPLHHAFHVITILAFHAMILFIFLFFHSEFKLPLYPLEFVFFAIFVALATGLSILYIFFPETYLFVLVIIVIVVFWVFALLKTFLFIPFLKKDRYAFLATHLISLFGLFAVLGEVLSYRYGKGLGLLQGASFLIAIFQVSIYLAFMGQSNKEKYEKQKFESQAKSLRMNVLLRQAGPHYLFNALNTVKACYGHSQEEGDRAIGLLSRNLRTLVESADAGLVPFEKEIQGIMDYVEFESLKTGKDLPVIYDIEETSFPVPNFAVQTLVENAVKHAEIRNKEGGVIEISTREEGDSILLSIRDNGVGFDPKSVPIGAGMRSSQERFRSLLGADMHIQSAPGEGTEIRIYIPKQEGNENESSGRGR